MSTRKKLYNLYWNKVLSMFKIAKLYNCSYETIRRRLIKYNIVIRTNSEANKLSVLLRMKNRRSYKGKNNPNFGKHKVEGKNNGRYIDGRTLEKNHCSCGRKIDYRNKMCKDCYLKYNNPMKTFEARSKESLTKGGTGIPYEFSNYPEEFYRIRYKILKRDNYICQKCLKYGNEVHHIDYNKENNLEENLICLCHKCNMKANKNRDYWFAYFKYLMEAKECNVA